MQKKGSSKHTKLIGKKNGKRKSLIDTELENRDNTTEYSNLLKERAPCLVVRKESARRWRHISEKRCLEEIGIRASNLHL